MLAVYYRDGQYVVDILDCDVGPANAMSYELNGNSVIISANREVNEIAYYTVQEE